MNEWQTKIASIAITAPLLIGAAVVLGLVFCMAVKMRMWLMGVQIQGRNGWPVELVEGRWFLNAIRVLIHGSCLATFLTAPAIETKTDKEKAEADARAAWAKEEADADARTAVPADTNRPPDPGDGYELIPGHRAFGEVKPAWDWLCEADGTWVPCAPKYAGIFAAVEYYRRKIGEE